MKKTNLIFFGAMGAIMLSVGAANAAFPTVASKGYVDAGLDTKMNKDNINTIGTGNVISSVTYNTTTDELDVQTATVATSEGLEDLEARVTINEGDITTIEGDITALETAMDTKIDDTITTTGTGNVVGSVVVDAATGEMTVNRVEVATDADMTAIENRVTVTEGDITTIEGDITTIEGDITDLQNDKQDALTAGDFINIDATTNTITTTLSAGANVAISDTGVISATQADLTGYATETFVNTGLDTKMSDTLATTTGTGNVITAASVNASGELVLNKGLNAMVMPANCTETGAVCILAYQAGQAAPTWTNITAVADTGTAITPTPAATTPAY